VSPHVLGCEVAVEGPWFDVYAKDVDLGPPRGHETFWSIRTHHQYTAVLAIRDDGLIPLVRLYRPAVEAEMLELPSGSIDPGETPEAAVRRELLEETGCRAGELVPLGSYVVDSGRLETLQWSFFAPGVSHEREPSDDEGLSLEFLEPSELGRRIRAGEFRHSVHLALIGSAVIGGLIAL
jgi:ADP-ribose pyrophosphatase